jgi:galactose mutarotase-like enzyme
VGEPSLYKTSLYIDASTYLNCRKLDLIPIDIKEVPDYLSFKKLKPITKDIENPNLMDSKARGYDHHYYFDNNDISSIKSSLVGQTYQMDIYTDFKGMQIYSVNYPNITPCYEIEPILHRSLAMEPQDGFLNNTILKPNETYNRFIRLSFKRKNN